MSPVTRIISFAKTRSPWQQDLIRRIYTQGELQEEDYNEALLMLKAHHDLVPGSSAPCPQCLCQDHLPYQAEENPSTVLLSLGDIKHANRLAQGQSLRFATNGITLIYGDNGSGKSGYCRLLKKLCRVRPGADEKILGNAFEDIEQPPAEVTVRYSINGEIKPVRWRDGDPPPDELSLFSVFDTKTIPIYANKESKLEFLPHSLDVLPKLGEICRVLGSKIDKEISELEAQTRTPLPVFPSETVIAAAMEKLSPTVSLKILPTIEQLQALGTWTEAHEQRLVQVETLLRTDAKAMASQCQQLKKAVEQLSLDLTAAERPLSDTAVQELLEKASTARTAREAANLAAKHSFELEPLSGVGSEAWRLMFKYAREYSLTVYPDVPFPATGSDKVCLLCQQPLSPTASERLQRFDMFVKDTAAAEAQTKENAFGEALAVIERQKLRASSDAENLLPGLEQIDSQSNGVKAQVAAFLTSLADRRAALLTLTRQPVKFEEIPALSPSPVPALMAAKERLSELIQLYEDSQDPEARKIIESQQVELLARKKLSENLTLIINRQENLVKLHKLRQCKSACNTKGISNKNNELREAFITEEYEERLNREIKLLDLKHLPLKLESRSDHGASYLEIDLKTTKSVRNKDILSDGEFRALAIACFLTEAGTIPNHRGLIIDDPVSSLDHKRTRKVAKRLVEEARGGRQIIIFTHDLVFYYDVINTAAAQGVPLIRHWLHFSNQHGFGTIAENEDPWQVKPTKRRLDYLDNKLARIRKIEDQESDDYRKAIGGFYTDVRETWERLVEEQLLNNVVVRLNPGVATQSLKGVQVEDEDYKRIFFGMKRASEFSGHDITKARQISFPSPSEIESDVAELKAYSNELKKRNEALERARRKLESPPPAVLG